MSSSTVRECAAYFKRERGFERCFLEMRKKWKSYGKIAGTIKIKAANEEEKRSIGRFFGKIYGDADITFRFMDFERALQETRFREVPLMMLLETYFDEELVSNREKRAFEERQREEFWSRMSAALEERERGAAAVAWLQGMAADKRYGYGTVLGLWRSGEAAAEAVVRNVCEGYLLAANAGEEGLPLAVLAAKVTGNPHYFDRGQIAAQLLLHILCFAAGREVPRDAAGVREIYRDAGIVTDEIASTVAFYGLYMRKGGGDCEIAEAFRKAGEPGILSLANLAGVQRVWAERERAYVVENEMVFSYLVKRCQGIPVTLLCTSGQLSYAAQRLIGLLCESKTEVYYSGDLDPEGIGIADRLWRKYPQSVQIWRMDVRDYLVSLSEEEIEEWRLRKLQGVEHPLLRETAEHIKSVGKAAYQENLLELLTQDILAEQ